MTVLRRAAAAVGAALITVALLSAAPAQARDTSWGGYVVQQSADTSWGGYSLNKADTSWGGY